MSSYHTAGEGNGRAKLNWKMVDEIRQKLSEGVTGRALCKEYGVSPGTISGIKNGTKWQRPVIERKPMTAIESLADIIDNLGDEDE